MKRNISTCFVKTSIIVFKAATCCIAHFNVAGAELPQVDDAEKHHNAIQFYFAGMDGGDPNVRRLIL
jgi:hypothetical protein